ncbi:hypothetical protein ACIA8J_06390 [Streptomyces asoensis]|uniref:hypothetical protein n=1 Tax=Streptomyces asoensis TaxID=249586 RepID=UPI0037ABA1F6
MTTGGTPTAGAAARLLGPALLAGLLTAGCGSPGAADAQSGPPAPPPASPSAGPSTTSPGELCTRVVAHWAREVLDSTSYGDYQSMGLSNGQYDILRTVVDAARTARKHQGASAADELIDRETSERCAARYRPGSPTEGPWQ